MTVAHRFTVYGDPRGKGRPRFTRRGHTYTDQPTAEYEQAVANAWKGEALCCIESEPTEITIDAFFKVPTSLSKKKRAELFGTAFLHKPDADNIGKIVLDALNGLAYQDDRQIDRLTVNKKYVWSDDERPRVEITIIGGGT